MLEDAERPEENKVELTEAVLPTMAENEKPDSAGAW